MNLKPSIMRSEEEVQAIRQAKQMQAEQQAQMAQAQQSSEIMKNIPKEAIDDKSNA
jgi:hypothetical protein